MYKLTTKDFTTEYNNIFDALIDYWKYSKFRYENLEFCQLSKDGDIFKQTVLQAQFDDRLREQIDRQAEIYSINKVIDYLKTKGKITTKPGLYYHVKNMIEGADYLQDGNIIFTERGLKKLFYQYLGIEFF